MVRLIYINTPACSALVGPDTSAFPAAALVFNFSDDAGAAPPPEEAHRSGHNRHCKPQFLAVSCCNNNAVCLERVPTRMHVRTCDKTDWTPLVLAKKGVPRIQKASLSPAAPCSSQPFKGECSLGPHASGAWGNNKGWPRWERLRHAHADLENLAGKHRCTDTSRQRFGIISSPVR